MRTPSAKEIEAVSKLDPPRRYEHFVKQVAGASVAWGLFDDGWAMAGDDEGHAVFPLWPAREYAERCRQRAWSDYVPREITLDEIFDWLIPMLRERGALPGIFPTPDRQGVTLSPDELEGALREEAAKYELDE